MKILCEYTPSGPSFVRSGWGRVFTALGHDFRFWDPSKQSAFDAFGEFGPELFIGTTYGVDRAVFKNIAMRPEMKVILFGSAWGPYLKDVDLKRYPITVVTEQEKATIEKLKKETGKPEFVFIHAHDRWLEGTMSGWREIGVEPKGVLNAADTFIYLNGKPRPGLKCDVGFVGGYWGYKGRNLDQYILPLCHPSKSLNVKIFGSQPWPIHQYLGGIEDADVPDLFASATVCPNVSEPHSTDLGWDCIERPFKILSSGGFCISDSVEELKDLFPTELPFAVNGIDMEDMVNYFVNAPDERWAYMEHGRRKVLMEHTYFDRVADFFDYLGMEKERARTLLLKANLLQEAMNGTV